MAPPNFPQGMSLHSLGYAALKYPSLPPSLPVPLTNQIGVLQRTPHANQNHMCAQIASQYIDTLIDFQTSPNPLLDDPTNVQYYFSSALNLLNFCTTSPDVAIRIARHPRLLYNVVEKMLQPDFEKNMKAVDRSGPPGFQPSGFDEDFGSIIQFVSTIILYSEEIPTLHPRLNDLVPKLQKWKRDYRKSHIRTIGNASERLVEQIRGMPPGLKDAMHQMQRASVVCGVVECGKSAANSTLTACAKCRIQRFCGQEHQKKDWKYHKHICCKGLVPAEGGSAQESAA